MIARKQELFSVNEWEFHDEEKLHCGSYISCAPMGMFVIFPSCSWFVHILFGAGIRCVVVYGPHPLRLWTFIFVVKLTEYNRCHCENEQVLICWEFEAINWAVLQVSNRFGSLCRKHFVFCNENTKCGDKFAAYPFQKDNLFIALHGISNETSNKHFSVCQNEINKFSLCKTSHITVNTHVRCQAMRSTWRGTAHMATDHKNLIQVNRNATQLKHHCVFIKFSW